MQTKHWLPFALLLATACGGSTEQPAPTEPTPAAFVDGKADSFAADSSDRWEQIKERCAAPADDEPIVFSNDFSWGYSIEEMGIRYEEIYASGKRLNNRAYWDEDRGAFMLPGTEAWGGDVELSRRLVENVTLHIEQSLALKYVDFVFFPDMGHAHLFIPEDHWQEVYADTPVSEFSRRYEAMFDDPKLKVFYHVAEQLQTRDDDGNLIEDRHTSWRFHTRNVVGDNNWERRIQLLTDFESKANTAHDLPDHKYYGAGFNLSASKDGCFPFENRHGEVQWYDISLEDLPFDTSQGGGGFDF